MQETSGKFGILVAVDGSASSNAAVRWAAREAAMRHLPITLIHVIPPAVVSSRAQSVLDRVQDAQTNQARHVLDDARRFIFDCVEDDTIGEVRIELSFSLVVPALIDASKDALMVVVGRHGTGAFNGHLLGSVGSGLLCHAHCPVAIINDDDEEPPTPKDTCAPILLGIDGSPSSERAAALAFDEASRRGVPLIALHAWSDVSAFPLVGTDWRQYEGDANEVLDQALARWQQQYPDVEVRRQVVCDQPARWLAGESAHAQVTIVGSHGRGGFAGELLGSVSSAVAGSVWVPVIVTRDS
jgi:nucleotide-binding universal stress UspA family protein